MKLRIEILCDLQSGELNYTTNVNDSVTFTGMLETAKHLFFKEQSKPVSKVVIPKILPTS